jgi:hypothetical protein
MSSCIRDEEIDDVLAESDHTKVVCRLTVEIMQNLQMTAAITFFHPHQNKDDVWLHFAGM